jgi:serine phosphatase RsbU (regulator of sigma subunit)/ligand-binding sensor domain-containing protein
LKRILFIKIILSFFCIIYAQPVKNGFVHFTEKDGLSSNVVNCIMQDKLGYIWIGTGNGVTIFNGYEFDNFTIAPGDSNFLQLPLTTSLYEDSKGNIWIGSVDGATKYDRNNKTFEFYSLSPFSQKYNRTFVVGDLIETSDNNILCLTYDFHYFNLKNGLFLIDTKSESISEINVANDDSTRPLIQILPLEDDKFLLTGVKGFAEYDYSENYIKWFPFDEPFVVISALKDDENNYWLGTVGKGLLHYNIVDSTYQTFSAFTENSYYRNLPPFNRIIYDAQKNLLIATSDGLIHFDIKTEQITFADVDTKNPSALNSSIISDVILDNSGSIWVASFNAGVSKYDYVKNNFNAYSAKEDDINSITPGWISTIYEYSDDELWLTSGWSTLVKFNLEAGTFIRKPLPNDFEVFDILETSTGDILMTGSLGFFRIDPLKWQFEKLDLTKNLRNELVFSAIEIDGKSIWYATTSGIFIYDLINNITSKVDFRDLGIGGSGSNSNQVFVKDKLQNIWIGTDNGLFKYDYHKKVYSRIGYSVDSVNSLKSQDINALYVDGDNNLWIGTWLGGLHKYDSSTESIKSYSQKDGLKSHSVQGILGDEENNALWLSTFDGISRFDIQKETFNNFGVDDGIHASQFADGGKLKTSKGLFVFGGSNGITVFNPKEIQSNLIPPKVSLVDFKLFNSSVVPGNNSILEKPIYETEKIVLNYNENDIQLDYFAAHFVDPSKNQYAYLLENYEDDWRYVGNQRSAIYPNLPPGEYVFKLKASNNNEVWNEEPRTLLIIIKSPPWSTWWAYSFYIIAFLGILYATRRFELNRQKKNTKIKESQLRAEAAELQAHAAEAQARAIQAENDRKTAELEEARELQLSMLPKELPQLPNLEIAVYMKTATEVGGDYYDFHVGIDETFTAVIGDATGHGMKAGTMVTSSKSLFSSYAESDDIVNTFHEMTRCIKNMHLNNLSMCMSMIKIKNNELRMSSAGMPPIYLFRKNTSSVEEYLFEGMPLGTMKKFPYKIGETKLHPGDTILLMSDGFPELMNDKKELYGYKRTKNKFKEVAEGTPEQIIDILKNEVSEWVDGVDPDDDVTFVVIKVK